MHIAFAGRIVPPITGSELVPLKVLQELARQDDQNQYTIFLSAQDRHLVDFDSENLRVVTYHNCWRNSIGSILWHQVLLPLIVIRSGVDILFVPHNRVPFLKTCHQVVILHDLAEFRVGWKYDLARMVYRKLVLRLGVQRAERIVTVSECSKRDIMQFLHISDERIAVIYNGVGEEFFISLPKEKVRESLQNYQLDSPYILYVGALEHPNKNLVRLLQAYHYAWVDRCLTHKLILVGPKRWRSEVILAEIERLNLRDQVNWLGYIPSEDLPYLYAGADLFVYLSLWEGFGLPVLEAMASGVPVIAANTSSLPEVVGEAGVLVDPFNVTDLGNQICDLLGDQEALARLSQAGRQRARLFTWKSSAEKLLHTFRHGSET